MYKYQCVLYMTYEAFFPKLTLPWYPLIPTTVQDLWNRTFSKDQTKTLLSYIFPSTCKKLADSRERGGLVGSVQKVLFFPKVVKKRIVSVSTPTTIATKKENDTSMYISKIIHCTINHSFFLKLRFTGYSHIPLAATNINNCRHLHRRKRLHMYVLAQDTFIHPYLHTTDINRHTFYRGDSYSGSMLTNYCSLKQTYICT